MGSCAWGTYIFSLFAHLAAYNLKQFGRMCLDFPQKWQTHAGLSCNLPLGGLGVLGLGSGRSTLIFLRGVTSIGLTISLTKGSEEGTKFVECVSGTKMLSTKPKPVFSKGDFWTLSMWSSLELGDLFVVL